MDITNKSPRTQIFAGTAGSSVPTTDPLRSKSSYRVTFESEKEVIRKDIGDLEQIRTRLGLSRRKICQILMVDPSAWTRWTRSQDGAPPHVYRMLEWYLLLKEKHPTLAHQYYERLSQPPRPEGEVILKQEILHQLKSTESRLKTVWSLELERVRSQLRNLSFIEEQAKTQAQSNEASGRADFQGLKALFFAGFLGFSLGLLLWGTMTWLSK
ncbi:MAG: hypothetical protein K2X47_04135 [Bdellovibrionales bacterium]|nr:hypothetical protein [Bdellovibrionales bacterium]